MRSAIPILLFTMVMLADAKGGSAPAKVEPFSLGKASAGSTGQVSLDHHPDGLTVVAKNGKAFVTLGQVERPNISQRFLAIHGQICYKEVAEDGYLEMWTEFSDGARYFSRGLAETGPFRKLKGKSDWRELIVPFDLKGAKKPVAKVELNMVLPGGGTVELRNLGLVEYDASDLGEILSGSQSGAAWWTAGQAGWVGGILGGVAGILGAVMGLCARRYPQATVVAAFIGSGLGLVALAVGIWAALARQPYAVWYPLVLGGGITAIVFGANGFSMRRKMRGEELRRMEAMDVAV